MAKSAKKGDTGHAVNVDHFGIVISLVKGYGSKYIPNNTAIKLVNLEIVYTNADGSKGTVTTTLKTYKGAIIDRHSLFKPLKPLATRILRALKASDVDDGVVALAKSFVAKIRGERIVPIAKSLPTTTTKMVDGEPVVVKTHSVSQQSFANNIEHMNGLVVLLTDETNYAPAETDLTIASLTAMVADMKLKHQACIDADTDYINSLISRNKILYAPKTGLYAIAGLVKYYVSTVYGFNSAEFRALRKIKFTRPQAEKKVKGV